MKLLNVVGRGSSIMVYDVAAVESGALSVLCDFYEEIRKTEDTSRHWHFIVSKPEFESTKIITVHRYPWIKKSWLHRLYFDHCVAPRLAKMLDIDEVVNLQNIWIPIKDVFQTIYLHQSLPFAEYKFGIFENFRLWVYQNIIGKFILDSLNRADRTIVQTQWMKEACIKANGVSSDRIQVLPPLIDIKPKNLFAKENMSLPTFIYPATPFVYKNHKVILEACKHLMREGITKFQIIFTMSGQENTLASNLQMESIKYNLPIKFVGFLTREELFEWYSKAILLFPSYIESFPLPLLEAKMHGTPIVVADTSFAKEILNGYPNCQFFQCEDNIFQCLLKYTILQYAN